MADKSSGETLISLGVASLNVGAKGIQELRSKLPGARTDEPEITSEFNDDAKTNSEILANSKALLKTITSIHGKNQN